VNLPDLHFPPIQARVEGGTVFDPVRRRWVRLTPEEWVRQHLIGFLVGFRGVPPALVAVEKGFEVAGQAKRADVVVYRRSGRPWLLAECKAPSVSLGEAALGQAAGYARVVHADVLALTNGLDHRAYAVAPGTLTPLGDLPSYPD
jgi:hypothetical protein